MEPEPDVSADDFEDLPAADDAGEYDPDGFLWRIFTDKPKRAPQKRQWHVADFPDRKLPDLTHDQLATDLGKAGWDEDARYVAQLGGWHLWKEPHWEQSPGMLPMAMVRSYVNAKVDALMRWAKKEAKRADNIEVINDARRWAKGLRQENSLTAVERLARSNVQSIATVDQWDTDDFLLETPGGTVDLRTGEMRPALRADYITKLTAVAPAPQGTVSSAWLKFLNDIFPADPEMPGFIQRLMGYALTGSTREHRLFLFHGTGRNGKGTLLSTVQGIMGDYARGIPTSALVESRNPQHASPLAVLLGARFVRGAELPVGQVWNESLVK